MEVCKLERREQVFVSSTYVDLKEERRAVIQGLLEADCIPSGMELFPASDSEKWDLIRGVIDDCDYYLLIVGGRYGSIDPGSDLSFTEMEFDYAVSINKPVMAFLHGEPGSISADKTELNPDARQKLTAFREKVEQKMVKYWKTADDLDGAVAKSLIKLRKTHPAEGWVKARHAMTPEVQRDLAELRARVVELTRQLEVASKVSSVEVPDDLADGDDEYSVKVDLVFWKKEDASKQPYVRTKWRSELELIATWSAILSSIGPTLLDESSEREMKQELRNLSYSLASEQGGLPDGFGGTESWTVHGDVEKDVIVQLFALGLIEHGIKKRPVNDSEKYWRLTTMGRDRLMKLRAIKRTV
jgi:hypothetical protein